MARAGNLDCDYEVNGRPNVFVIEWQRSIVRERIS
jgi:hypothetical protein